MNFKLIVVTIITKIIIIIIIIIIISKTQQSTYGDGCCMGKRKKNLLDQNVKRYQEKWKRGHVLENSQVKLVFIYEKREQLEGQI